MPQQPQGPHWIHYVVEPLQMPQPDEMEEEVPTTRENPNMPRRPENFGSGRSRLRQLNSKFAASAKKRGDKVREIYYRTNQARMDAGGRLPLDWPQPWISALEPSGRHHRPWHVHTNPFYPPHDRQTYAVLSKGDNLVGNNLTKTVANKLAQLGQ